MPQNTRRHFIGGAAALAAASAVPAPAPARTVAEHHWDDVRLAVATYSLREFSRDRAIRIVRELGIKYVNVKSFHMPYYLSKEELTEARKEFEDAGLTIVSGGNVGLRSEDEGYIKRHLEYCKNGGIPVVVCAPTHSNLKLVEKHAVRLGLKIAIHNHGPEDDFFPNGTSVLKHVGDMDPCMGLCYDVGHALRTGVDVIEGRPHRSDGKGTRHRELRKDDGGDLVDDRFSQSDGDELKQNQQAQTHH